MNADILHSGFDGLKFTVQTDIPTDLRDVLTEAKVEATRSNREIVIERGGMKFAVRRSGGMAFSVHTGEYGAEWFFLDPENRAPNNPGVTVDFRAFLLATGGLDAAQNLFEESMAALGIRYVETQLRVSRVDFAVDFLAPWFEPNYRDLVLPPGTRQREFRESDTTQTFCTGAQVTGIVSGGIANRQLAIYDKRAEVIAKRKLGWLEIWNHSQTEAGKPPFDLSDKNLSQVWRFEMRMGSKQLRNRWQMKSWFDLDAMIGDAYSEFCARIRYCIPQNDSNRSRWASHELWQIVEDVIKRDLHTMRSGVVPDDVKRANRNEHMDMLDGMSLGLLVSRAAAEGVEAAEFEAFAQRNLYALLTRSKHHPIPLGERLAKASGKYRFR